MNWHKFINSRFISKTATMRNSDFSKLHDRILDIISASQGVVTTAEVASKFKISWNTSEKYLLELALENQVIRVKKAGANLWILARTAPPAAKKHHGSAIGRDFDE